MDNKKKDPKKGILKKDPSLDHTGKRAHYDEMNVLATHHPPDKDYGHQKIDEPKTPYNYANSEDGSQAAASTELHEDDLHMRLAGQRRASFNGSEEGDDDHRLTPEEKAKREAFEKRRKQHYNEFERVKAARKQSEEEEKRAANKGKHNSADDEEDEPVIDPVVEEVTVVNTLLNAAPIYVESP